MEKRNLFVSGKAVVAAVCGAFTAAFGWLGWLVVAWAACMALDWVSGSAAAASRGAWSSAAARAGIWHKAGMVVVVLVCALTDAVLAVAVANLPGLGLEVNGVVLPVVLVWYIFTELGSIAENAAAMGARLRAEIDPLTDRHAAVAEVRQMGRDGPPGPGHRLRPEPTRPVGGSDQGTGHHPEEAEVLGELRPVQELLRLDPSGDRVVSR